MRDKEILREKRDREFQARVLAALERPKKARVIAIINSGFFLWLISALFLTFGSAIYQARQTCTSESAARKENLRLVQEEITDRVLYFVDAVDKTKTPEDLFGAIRARKPFYDQFRQKTLFDLTEEQRTITNFLSPADAYKVGNALSLQVVLSYAAQAEINRLPSVVLAGLKASLAQNVELPRLVYVSSNCSLLSLLRQTVLGTRDYLVVDDISPSGP